MKQAYQQHRGQGQPGFQARREWCDQAITGHAKRLLFKADVALLSQFADKRVSSQALLLPRIAYYDLTLKQQTEEMVIWRARDVHLQIFSLRPAGHRLQIHPNFPGQGLWRPPRCVQNESDAGPENAHRLPDMVGRYRYCSFFRQTIPAVLQNPAHCDHNPASKGSTGRCDRPLAARRQCPATRDTTDEDDVRSDCPGRYEKR